MANTGLSHTDITNKFDAADLDEVDIEIDEPASEETSPDYFDTPADETISPDRDFEAPVDEVVFVGPCEEASAPVDEEIVEPVDHADARCIEAKQHVTNCGCTGSCRGPF